MQIDTTRLKKQDSITAVITDTTAEANKTAPKPIKKTVKPGKITKKIPQKKIVEKPQEEKELTDTMATSIVPQEQDFQPFTLFSHLTEQDSSVYSPHSQKFIKSETALGRAVAEVSPVQRNFQPVKEKGWVLGIASLTIVILIIIKIYFQKQFETIISSTVNLQVSDKLMREKNVIVRRIFLLLNINFVIILALYLYIVFQRFSINVDGLSGLKLFLLLFAVLSGIQFIRIVLLHVIGQVFHSMPLFREYIHNSYLLNKNLGLYLLPVVISIFYLSHKNADIVFYFATALVFLSILYKYIRSIQIILRYKVFYFYSFLYLCTLEILPALVGFKFVLSLR